MSLPELTQDPRLADELYRLAAGVRLTPAQRRILSYLTENRHDSVFLSTADLARAVGVSQPSVSRLASALGFEGYAAMRESLQLRMRAPAPGAKEEGTGERIAHLESANVAALPFYVDDATCARIAADIMGSREVVIAGWRASSYLRRYFAYFARKVHPGVVEVGDDELDTLARSRRAGATHALFVIMPRYPRVAMEALLTAQRLGLRCIVVADPLFVPPAPLTAEHSVVRLPVGSGTAFDAHPGVLVFLARLLEAMCDTDLKRIDGLLEAMEDDAEQLRTYWD